MGCGDSTPVMGMRGRVSQERLAGEGRSLQGRPEFVQGGEDDE